MNRKEFEQTVPVLRSLMVKVGCDFFGNMEDAEDVAQDALVRLWNYCERLDADRNLNSLAITVAKNICVEKYKRRQMTIMKSTSETQVCTTYSADNDVIAQETQEQIDSAINRLSPREQQLVRKRFIEDQSAEDIAHELNIPKPSVKSMLSAAKSKLIKILNGQ